MSRLRHVTRQRLIYLVGLSLGIINQNEINRKWMFCWMLTPKTSRGGGHRGFPVISFHVLWMREIERNSVYIRFLLQIRFFFVLYQIIIQS